MGRKAIIPDFLLSNTLGEKIFMMKLTKLYELF